MRKVNIIPLAGNGQRFKDKGYLIPKPLLPVCGVPMILQSAKSLPECDKWIFICQKKHLDESELETIIKKNFNSAEIIAVEELTNGQATSCYASKQFLRGDDILNISATDVFFEYDKEKYIDYIKNKYSIVFGFKKKDKIILNPEYYGWIKFDKSFDVKKVSCKIPISLNPQNDYAVVGSFSFPSAEIFIKNYKLIIQKKRLVNNEFYIDTIMDEISRSSKLKILTVNNYISWGTPVDYEKNKNFKI